MEGDQDLGSYRDGHCYQAELDGELSVVGDLRFGSVIVLKESRRQGDWDGVKMCLDWDQPVNEWICELSLTESENINSEYTKHNYSIDCEQDRQKECKPFL